MGAKNTRRRVVLCCRISTSDQDNYRQDGNLREYPERANFEIVGVFKETLSGIRRAKASIRRSASG
jgi:putative DNA-invertase from lambdoid prophage Rac